MTARFLDSHIVAHYNCVMLNLTYNLLAANFLIWSVRHTEKWNGASTLSG